MIILMLMVVSAVTLGVGYTVVGAFWDDHQDIKKQMEEAEILRRESRSEFTWVERQVIPPRPQFSEGGYLPISPRTSYNTDNLPASMLTVDELIQRIESL